MIRHSTESSIDIIFLFSSQDEQRCWITLMHEINFRYSELIYLYLLNRSSVGSSCLSFFIVRWAAGFSRIINIVEYLFYIIIYQYIRFLSNKFPMCTFFIEKVFLLALYDIEQIFLSIIVVFILALQIILFLKYILIAHYSVFHYIAEIIFSWELKNWSCRRNT